MSLVQDAMTPPPPGSPGAPASPSRPPQATAAASVPEKGDFLNLAQRPFLNSRPVVRTATILWLLGTLLLLGNVMLFWSYLSESEEKRTELTSLESQIEAERARTAQLKEQVAGLNLEQYNRGVQYLNRKIQERTFSWSLLFDHLTRLMPNDVRISRLKPSGVIDPDADRRASGSVMEEGVSLQLQVEAKNEEAFARFVDNLYTPPFDYPDYSRETLADETEAQGGRIKYDLTVRYLPEAAEPQGQGIGAAPEVSIQELPADPAAAGDGQPPAGAVSAPRRPSPSPGAAPAPPPPLPESPGGQP